MGDLQGLIKTRDIKIAHLRYGDRAKKHILKQTVEEHCKNVAEYAYENAECLGLKYTAFLAGLIHDLGKYTDLFQEYIMESFLFGESSKKGKIDHSTYGARLLFDLYHTEKKSSVANMTIEWVSMITMSHHSGVRNYINPDGTSYFLNRIQDKMLPEYDKAVQEFFMQIISKEELNILFEEAKKEVKALLLKIHTIYKNNASQKSFYWSMVVRMLCSILIDADRLDTAEWMEPQRIHKYANPHQA